MTSNSERPGGRIAQENDIREDGSSCLWMYMNGTNIERHVTALATT
jgi:hypothetical protein